MAPKHKVGAAPNKWKYWAPESGQYVRVLRVSKKTSYPDFKVGEVVQFSCPDPQGCKSHRVDAYGCVRRNGGWFYLTVTNDSSESTGVVHCCAATPDEEAVARLKGKF